MSPHASGDLLGNRYEIVRFLGRGASGEVYEAIDLHMDSTCAIKLLGSPESPAWHEAQILEQLRCEFILPVRNADFAGGVQYLVTELAEHGTAGAYITPTGLPPQTAVRWVREACRGAARTHDARLLHRDIKPDNIFLDGRGGALLGDFGMAHLMDGSGSAPPQGTPMTVAPELLQGGRSTVRSDVYSLGATLYAMLAGRYAHDGANKVATQNAVLAGPGPSLRDLCPHVSRALAERVERAMARDPAARYSTSSEFDADLGGIAPAARNWIRTDEHTDHARCWRGHRQHLADVFVCELEAGRQVRVDVKTAETNRRVHNACQPLSPRSKAAVRIRAAMRTVDG